MVTITITNVLGDLWTGTADDFEGMTDAQVIALVKEDLTAFIDGACWTVERSDSLGSLSVPEGSPRSSQEATIEPSGSKQARKGIL